MKLNIAIFYIDIFHPFLLNTGNGKMQHTLYNILPI